MECLWNLHDSVVKMEIDRTTLNKGVEENSNLCDIYQKQKRDAEPKVFMAFRLSKMGDEVTVIFFSD